jgi:hypothetical protein
MILAEQAKSLQEALTGRGAPKFGAAFITAVDNKIVAERIRNDHPEFHFAVALAAIGRKCRQTLAWRIWMSTVVCSGRHDRLKQSFSRGPSFWSRAVTSVSLIALVS